MIEIWKDIEGYNGIYQISNLGRVRSLGSTKNKIETGKIYSSTREVERKFCISHTCVSDCCNGKQKTAGGFHWEFIGGDN